jgi:uncharacterized phage protein (TIGR02218 family)
MRQSTNMTLISALLARTPMWSVDLFTVSLLSGDVYRWASADRDIVFSGNTWSAMGPAIQRSKWSAKNTTEVSEMEITLYSTGLDFPSGNLKKLIHDGLFDGAFIQLDRAYMPTYGDTSLGLVTLFGGRVGKVEINALGATVTCVAANVLMQQNIPRNTFQLGCIHTLYDSGCTVDRGAHTATFTVTSASTLTVNFSESALGDPAIYVLGTLAIVDGIAAGQRRQIDGAGGQSITVAYPLLDVPAAGDHFTLTQGCSKTIARCTQFGNLPNYRGFPNIPPASSGL